MLQCIIHNISHFTSIPWNFEVLYSNRWSLGKKKQLTSSLLLRKGFKSNSTGYCTNLSIFSSDTPSLLNLLRCSASTCGGSCNLSCFSIFGTWFLHPSHVNLTSGSSMASTCVNEHSASGRVLTESLLISRLKSRNGSKVSEQWPHSPHLSWKVVPLRLVIETIVP